MDNFDALALDELKLLNEQIGNLALSKGNQPKKSKAEIQNDKNLALMAKLQKREEQLSKKKKKLHEIQQTQLDQAKAATEQYKQDLDDEKKAQEKDRKNSRAGKKADAKKVRETGGMWKNIGLSFKEIPGDMTNKLAGSLSSKGGVFGSMAGHALKKIPMLGMALAGIGTAIGWVSGKFMNLLDATNSLTLAGVNSQGGLLGVADSANALNMQFSEYADFASKYARTMNIAGKGFSTSLESVSSGMLAVGFTTSEAAEYLGGYLETQRLSGLLSKQSVAQQLSAGKELATQTLLLAGQFGTSTDEINSGIIKAYDDPLVKAAMRSLPASVKNAFDKSMAFFSAAAPELADGLAELMGSVAPQLTDTYKTAMAAGVPGVANAMAGFAQEMKNGANEEQARRKLLKKLANTDIKILRIRASLGDANAKAVLGQIMAAREAQEAMKAHTAENYTALGFSAKMRQMWQAFGKLGDRFFSALMKGIDGVDKTGITKLMKGLGDAVNDASEWVLKFFSDKGGVGNIGNILGTGINIAIEWIQYAARMFIASMQGIRSFLETIQMLDTEDEVNDKITKREATIASSEKKIKEKKDSTVKVNGKGIKWIDSYYGKQELAGLAEYKAKLAKLKEEKASFAKPTSAFSTQRSLLDAKEKQQKTAKVGTPAIDHLTNQGKKSEAEAEANKDSAKKETAENIIKNNTEQNVQNPPQRLSPLQLTEADLKKLAAMDTNNALMSNLVQGQQKMNKMVFNLGL